MIVPIFPPPPVIPPVHPVISTPHMAQVPCSTAWGVFGITLMVIWLVLLGVEMVCLLMDPEESSDEEEEALRLFSSLEGDKCSKDLDRWRHEREQQLLVKRHDRKERP